MKKDGAGGGSVRGAAVVRSTDTSLNSQHRGKYLPKVGAQNAGKITLKKSKFDGRLRI